MLKKSHAIVMVGMLTISLCKVNASLEQSGITEPKSDAVLGEVATAPDAGKALAVAAAEAAEQLRESMGDVTGKTDARLKQRHIYRRSLVLEGIKGQKPTETDSTPDS